VFFEASNVSAEDGWGGALEKGEQKPGWTAVATRSSREEVKMEGGKVERWNGEKVKR